MRKALGRVRNEKGAIIAVVAISLVVILGMGALVVDMGMLIKQRTDAQRAADAAALAGASAYINAKPFDAVDKARERAFAYLAKNYVGQTYIDTSGKSATNIVNGNRYITTAAEGEVVVLPDSVKVRVFVRRAAVGTFFARILGILNVPIAAKAAAIAATQGAGKCIKPFAIPDMWQEMNTGSGGEDKNSNAVQDDNEKWEYNATATTKGNKTTPADHYRGYQDPDPNHTGVETGWGSDFRNSTPSSGTVYNDDFGRLITLKPNSPGSAPAPGFFQAFDLEAGERGAKDYEENIKTCNPVEIHLQSEYDVDDSVLVKDNEPGNMLGPTKRGIADLISQDAGACWAEFPDLQHPGYMTGEVRKLSGANTCTESYPGWEGSARVIYAPLFDPTLVTTGRTELKFNNLAVFFLEQSGPGNQDPIVARFLYFAKGTGTGETSGSLVKVPKLVE